MKHPATLFYRRTIAVLLLFTILSPAAYMHAEDRVLPKPADWGDNDWYKFIENAVQIAIGEAHGAAGGVVPMMDIYSALNAAGASTKTALQVWLRRKIADAYTSEDFKRGDRYNAFYTCLTFSECDELRRLEQQIKGAKQNQPDDSGVDLSGEYGDDWGYVIQLNHAGGNITGTFTKGTYVGQFTSGSFDPATCKVTLEFTEPWKKSKGTAELVLSQDGTRIGGNYKSIMSEYSAPQTGSWTFYRKGEAAKGCSTVSTN